MRVFYVFDIDGTLSDPGHRVHILKNKRDLRRWDDFYGMAKYDAPISPVLRLFSDLWFSQQNVRIWTGRTESIRADTVRWLHRFTSIDPSAISMRLLMRPDGNNVPDYIIKKIWLEDLSRTLLFEDRIVAFEDRKRCVEMFRAHGVTCLQVAEGDY